MCARTNSRANSSVWAGACTRGRCRHDRGAEGVEAGGADEEAAVVEGHLAVLQQVVEGRQHIALRLRSRRGFTHRRWGGREKFAVGPFPCRLGSERGRGVPLELAPGLSRLHCRLDYPQMSMIWISTLSLKRRLAKNITALL